MAARKEIRLLGSVVLLVMVVALLWPAPAAQAQTKVFPHEQPIGTAGDGAGMSAPMAYGTFDNPAYYYASVQAPPSGTYYRSVGQNPDGTQLIAQKSWNDGTYNRTEVVLMDADGANEMVISPGDSGEGDIYAYMNPFWSDDGTAIGFVEVHNANPNKVIRYDIGSATRSYIYEPAAPDDVANPDFLGSSKTSIVFWAYGSGGSVADLFIWDGATRTNITNTSDYKEYEPVSNDDGSVILYWSGETTAEPVNTTHTLTNVGGTWTKDVGFTPIADSYWAFWSGRSDDYIGLTVMSSKDVHIYDDSGAFVMDLTGPGYAGGAGQWNFFGFAGEGPNGEYVMTSNANRVDPGRDIVFAAPRTELYVDDDGSDSNPGTEAAPFATIQKGIDEAASGGAVNVAPGTYTEALLIDKPLTVSGATASTNKNGYAVPAGYAWDDTVESIINHPNPSGGYTTIVDIYDTDDVTFEGFVVQELNAEANKNSSLVRVYAHTGEISNIIVRNNIIGPNTNTTFQDGTHGRMGLYIVNHPYGDKGVVNSTFSGNKIFDCQGNGDNIFLWSSYHAYGAPGPASMSSTVIEDNEIYGAHRIGIETAGGFSDLTIRNNKIYDNSGPGDIPDLKYGTGILMIRGSGDKLTCDGYGPVDVTIEGNEIYDNEDHGIYMGPNNQGVTIEDNDIHDNGKDAVRVDLIGNYWNPDFDPNPGPYTCLGGSSSVTAWHNRILDNGAGAQVIGTPSNGFVLDANENWWGAASGPGPVGPGSGDDVSTHVDYSPWCTDSACGGTASEGPGGEIVVLPGMGQAAIQAVLDSAPVGATILFQAGTYGFSLSINNPGLILTFEPGVVFSPSSPCFYLWFGATFNGNGAVCEPTSGSDGFVTMQDLNNLTIQEWEIRKGTGKTTGDGVHVGHNVTNLRIVDCYMHELDQNGIYYASGKTVGGVHEVQGNLFQSNTMDGVKNSSASSYVVEYNSWGHLDGPNSGGDGASGSLDFTPWTHVEVLMESSGSLKPDKVRVGYQIDYTVKMDAQEAWGADFDMSFDNTLLSVVSITDLGNFDQHPGLCTVSTPAQANSSGIISFCGSSLAAVNGAGQGVYKVTFQGLAAGVSDLDLDDATDSFAMAPPSGASTNIYAHDLVDRQVTVYAVDDVTGRIDLQGRTDDTGAQMEFGLGYVEGYGPYPFSPSDSWGAISVSDVVHDQYDITTDMNRYLDVTAASGKSVTISGPRTLTTLVLLGGDANDTTDGTTPNPAGAGVIDISDASVVGSDFGNSPPVDVRADINNDNSTDILDLVLVGGNYLKTSATAYASWTP